MTTPDPNRLCGTPCEFRDPTPADMARAPRNRPTPGRINPIASGENEIGDVLAAARDFEKADMPGLPDDAVEAAVNASRRLTEHAIQVGPATPWDVAQFAATALFLIDQQIAPTAGPSDQEKLIIGLIEKIQTWATDLDWQQLRKRT